MNRPGRGQRQIIKQGYLKKVSNSRKLTWTFKRPEQRWVVFGILGGNEPYLEYYISEEGVFTSPPLSYISLLACKHVSHSFINSKFDNNFTIITDEKIVDLIAPSRGVMLEWCSIVERKLKSMHILTASKENDYEITRVPRRVPATEAVIQVSRDYSQPLDSQDNERPRTATPSSIPTSPAPLPPEPGQAGAVFFGDSSSLPNSPAPIPPSDAPEQVFFSEAELNQPPVVPPRPAASLLSPQTSEENLSTVATPQPPPRLSAGSGSNRSSGASDLEVCAIFSPKLEQTDSLRRPGRDPKSPLPPPPLLTKNKRRPPPPLPVQRPVSSPILPRLQLPHGTHQETSATLSRIDDLRKRPLPPPPLPQKSEIIRRRSQLLQESNWDSSSDSSSRGSTVLSGRDSYSSTGSSDHVEGGLSLDLKSEGEVYIKCGATGAVTSSATGAVTSSAGAVTSSATGAVTSSATVTSSASSQQVPGSTESANVQPSVTYASVVRSIPEPLNTTADLTKSPEVQELKERSLERPIPAPRTKKLLQQSLSDACQTQNQTQNLPQDRDSPRDRYSTEESCIPKETSQPADSDESWKCVKKDCDPFNVSGANFRDQSSPTAFHSNKCDQSDGKSSSESLDIVYDTPKTDPELFPKTLQTEAEQNLVIPASSSFSSDFSDSFNISSSLNTSDNAQTVSVSKTESTSTPTAALEGASKCEGQGQAPAVVSLGLDERTDQSVNLKKTEGSLVDIDINENTLKITMNQEDTYQSLWNGSSPLSTARPAGRTTVSSVPNAIAPPPVVPRRSIQQSQQKPQKSQQPGSPGVSENGAGTPNTPSRQLSIVSGRARPAGDEPSPQQQVNGLQFGARVPVGQPVFLCDEDEEAEIAAAASTQSQLQQARLRGFNRTNTTPSPPPSEPIPPLVAPVYPQAPDGARGATGGATYLPRPEVVRESSNMSALPPKMLEAMGLDDPVVGGWNQPPGEEGAPPPYLPRNVLERGASKSLKESQVELLNKEMSHPGGVRVMLRRVDCHHTLALLDGCKSVWIGGWNQEARPFLHNAFHVGDKVISINGQVVENVKMANKLIKHCHPEDKITFILRRLPHGRVFALKREVEGQSLGIKRIGGTNEIEDIQPYGLAAKHGIPAKAPTLDGTNLCNWWITEVNNRPVSLFYKNNEVEHRLNAVGKDITILIQPTDLVQEFRTQLKLLKNYKDFVVQ